MRLENTTAWQDMILTEAEQGNAENLGEILAIVQRWDQLLCEREIRIDQLSTENDTLRARVDELEAERDELKAMMQERS